MPAKSKKGSAAQANQPRPSTPNVAGQSTALLNGKPGDHHASSTVLTNGLSTAAAETQQDVTTPVDDANAAPHVNRKKQKRREKEAAKRAADQLAHNPGPAPAASNGQLSHPLPTRGPTKGYFNEETDYVNPDFEPAFEPDDAFYSGDEDGEYDYAPPNGDYTQAQRGLLWRDQQSRKKRKNKKGGISQTQHSPANMSSNSLARSSTAASRSQMMHRAPLSNAALRSAHKMSTEQIWNTSSQKERENIKQFWLELGEEERRSLVKVEKEAVLRKMKEQQKHSCSCTVCGRKRTAIEEELEVLYDAYYEELEQFANHDNPSPNGHPMMSNSRMYRQLRNSAPPMAGAFPTNPSRGRVQELGEEDEDLEDDEEYDDDDEAYSDDDVVDPGPPDFFTFGNSLTVKDGILTVADDLLKNDGKHFIDMMEQLAERRMQREEAVHFPATAHAHPHYQGHNHPPLDEEDDYDDEDDDEEDYDSQEEDEFENDEMDSMTEEQRMEEGRRMFQIFAARMFEQRVLTAYKEKVSREKQQKLLAELEAEDQTAAQREAKRAKEAAKKKEKKKQQKQAKEEEKAKKDAEKAAQEAALRAEEEKKLEEQRQRKEEQRKKREAERKAAEEERLRKEAEKQRKLQEERDRQADAERKQREAKEREKKKREEAKKKEREARDAKEREMREKKAAEDAERRAREEAERREKEAVAKADRESKERIRQEQAAKRQPIALPPGLHPPSHLAHTHLQSPSFPIATPIVPSKAPTPGRPRQTSQQGQQSYTSSPRSQQADASHSSASPASVAIPQTPATSHPSSKAEAHTPMLHHPQPSAPISPLNNASRGGQLPFSVNGLPGLGLNGPHMSAAGMAPGLTMPTYQGPPMSGPQRYGPPQNLPYPPGFGQPRQFQQNHHMPYQPPPIHQPSSAPQQPPPQHGAHSRQQSLTNPDQQPAPIARPGPIGRAPSTTPDKKNKHSSPDTQVDDLATQLGSKALLDDSDIPLASGLDPMTNSLPPLGAPGSGRAPFSNNFPEPKHDTFGLGGSSWTGFSPNMPSQNTWGAPSSTNRGSAGWNQVPNNAFGGMGGVGGLQNLSRPHLSRPVAVRMMLVQACKQLCPAPGSPSDGFIPAQSLLRLVEYLNVDLQKKDPASQAMQGPVTMDELLAITDTEGNANNGGGSFTVKSEPGRGDFVKFESDGMGGSNRKSAAGDIGSPVMAPSSNSFGGMGMGGAFGAPGRGF